MQTIYYGSTYTVLIVDLWHSEEYNPTNVLQSNLLMLLVPD